MWKVIPGLLLFYFLGCKSQEQKNAAATQKRWPLKEVIADSYGGSDSSGLLVIRNQKALQAFMSGVNKSRKPGLPLPDVDFALQMVVVYSGGPGREAAPRLHAVAEGEEAITLALQHAETPEPDSEALLQPFILYTMPFTGKEVLLQEKP